MQRLSIVLVWFNFTLYRLFSTYVLFAALFSKTTLINQIKKPLEDINGRFIQVKFDFNTQPDTVLFSALDSFIEDIHDDEEGRELKQRIKEALGSEMS